MARAKKRRGGRPRKRSVSVAPMPLGGDHGTGTAAALVGTELKPLTDEKGRNPNNMGQRRRVEVIDRLKGLTLRQYQAAVLLRDAYCRVQQLSSGGELKEQVDASPKPDAAIAAQVDTMSHFAYVTKGIRRIDRPIIEHVCFENQPLRTFRGHSRQSERLRQALDLVADHMRY